MVEERRKEVREASMEESLISTEVIEFSVTLRLCR